MAELFKDIGVKRNGSAELLNGGEQLQGKVVAIYFSAHWCPPCRAFTPVLKDFYQEVTKSEDFEIVFVSFDKSEKELNDYLSEAHGNWLYVPFGNENIQTLANKYNVSGIPALIIVKSDGTLINAEGRSDVQDKLVAIYFAAHWCPPCREFTPMLKRFYEEIVKTEPFEIIYVPFDSSEEELDHYLKESHGPWLYLPYKSDQIQKMRDLTTVSGIPSIVVMTPDGTVITQNGRVDVELKPTEVAFAEWKGQTCNKK